MRQHIRKTVLSSAILFTTFFTAHGVYMWFPYILNNINLYVAKYDEPKRLCDILRFAQSSNFTLDGNTEVRIWFGFYFLQIFYSYVFPLLIHSFQ